MSISHVGGSSANYAWNPYVKNKSQRAASSGLPKFDLQSIASTDTGQSVKEQNGASHATEAYFLGNSNQSASKEVHDAWAYAVKESGCDLKQTFVMHCRMGAETLKSRLRGEQQSTDTDQIFHDKALSMQFMREILNNLNNPLTPSMRSPEETEKEKRFCEAFLSYLA